MLLTTAPDGQFNMERRRFSRVLMNAKVGISQGEESFETSLVDLSLKGALLEKITGPHDVDVAAPVDISIDIEGMEFTIKFTGKVSHIIDGRLGIECQKMDIDSATELRRLVELNLGDETLLHRELAMLGGDD